MLSTLSVCLSVCLSDHMRKQKFPFPPLLQERTNVGSITGFIATHPGKIFPYQMKSSAHCTLSLLVFLLCGYTIW